jgi:eukaryotic-like serine/threonine-protein kinase
MSESSLDRDPFEVVAESFLARFRAGERPSIEEFASRHPEMAEQIRDLLPALVLVEQDLSVDRKSDGRRSPLDGPLAGVLPQLGDYQILREIGRGGMGIVYEAIQQSLGRHVALKVLPWSSVGSGSNLERFRLEARAAARLHHTNIVPVFGVGEHEGTHYFAMQFIRGEGLDEIIKELLLLNDRRQDAKGGELTTAIPENDSRTLARTVARGLMTGQLADPTPVPADRTSAEDNEVGPPSLTANWSQANPETSPAPESPRYSAVTVREDAPGSILSERAELTASERHYFRGVAQIALQVAEALDYAHGQRILHRDIKPSNLMMDAHGTVWVTDFGLAKADDSDGPTRTGDIVGTLRYMAPERFEGQSDPRSDIYALGATLYELLTLRAAFDEPNRGRLIDHVLHRDPIPPRVLDPRIPRDLEVICLKCLSKEPERRYATAADLRDELRRFLAGEPIRARQSGAFERGWRWARRNPAVAGLLTALAAALLTGFLGIAWQWRRAEGKAVEALDAARLADFQAGQARSAADRAGKEARRADEARDQARLDKARAYFDQGRDLAERGDVVRGMFWMIEALKSAPDGQRGLDALIRSNLAAWERAIVPVRRVFSPEARIHSFSFDADGKFLLTSGLRIQQWAVTTGREAGPSFTDRGGPSFNDGAGGRLSPDGQTVLTAAWRSEDLQLRDRATGRPIGPRLRSPFGDLPANGLGTVYSESGFIGNHLVYLSGFGRPAQSGPHTYALWFFSARDGSPAGHLDLEGRIAQMDVGPGGRQIAIGEERGVIRSYLADFSGFRPSRSFQTVELGERLVSLVFSPDGKCLATLGASGVIRLWDAVTGRPLEPAIPAGSGIGGLRFSPDGAILYCWCPDLTKLFLEPTSGRRLAPGIRLLGWGEVIHPSGEFALVNDNRGRWLPYQLDLRNLAGSSRPPGAHAPTQTRLQHAVISDDRSRMVVAGTAHARIIDIASGLPSCPDIPLRWAGHTRVLLSRNGKRVAVVSNNISGSSSGTTDCRIDLRDTTTGQPLCPPIHPINSVVAVDFSPDGRSLAVGDYSNVVQLYDSASGDRAGRAMLQAGIVWQVAFSPDGGRLAVSTTPDRGAIPGCRVWDLRRYEPVGEALEIPPGSTVQPAIQFSPDGERLLIAVEGRESWIWDMRSRTPIGHDSNFAVARSRPGTQDFLIGTSAGNVRLWNGRTGAPLSPTMRPPNADGDKAVTALGFAPDGRRFAAGYEDGTVRVWDLDSAQPIGPPRRHTASVLAVAFSLDGKKLTSCSADGQLQTRILPPPIAGSLDRFAAHLQLQTGMTFDGGVGVPLTSNAWFELHQRLKAEEGWSDAIGALSEDMALHEDEARRFEQSGDAFAARFHLDRLLRTRPDDAILRARRAFTLALDGEIAAADAELTRAFTSGPADRLGEFLVARAHDFDEIERPKAALWALDHAIRRRANDWWLFADRALVHDKLSDVKARDADRDRAVDLGADSLYVIRLANELQAKGSKTRADALRDLAVQRLKPGASYQMTMGLASDLARRGRYDRAADLIDRFSRQNPPRLAQVLYFELLLRLQQGDQAGYRAACARLLGSLPPKPSGGLANSVAWPCVLGPEAVADLGRVVRLAEIAVDKTTGEAKSMVLNTLGAALYRARRHSEAISRLEEGIELRKGNSLPQDWAFLAMAHQALGDTAAARHWLKKLADRTPSQQPGAFQDELEIDVLRREAEALIRFDPVFPANPFAGGR